MDDRIYDIGHNQFSFNNQIYGFNDKNRIGCVEDPAHNVYVVRTLTGKLVCKVTFVLFPDLKSYMIYIEGSPDTCEFKIIKP